MSLTNKKNIQFIYLEPGRKVERSVRLVEGMDPKAEVVPLPLVHIC